MNDDWDFFDDPTPVSNDRSYFQENAPKTTSASKYKGKQSSLSSNSGHSGESNLHGTDYIKTDSKNSDISDTEDPTPKNLPSSSATSISSSSTSDSTFNKKSNETYTKHGDSSTSESETPAMKYSVSSSRKSPRNSKYGLEVSSSDSSDQSSDSVTDVSPLSTPEASPKFKRRNHRMQESKSEEKNKNMKHVTKLNVTFGSKQTQKLPEKQYRNSSKYSDYYQDPLEIYRQELQHNYDLSCSSDDDYSDDMKYWGHPKAGYNRRRTEAIEKHRKRMLSSSANRTMDISKLLETVLDFDKQQKQRRQNRNRGDFELSPGRQNMSFTNMQVNEIDRENNRLLKEITKSKRARPSSASSMRSSTSNASTVSRSSRQSQDSRLGSGTRRRQMNPPPVKLYHSAQNRLQYQRQIERENLQLLKRLRSAKGTPELRKSMQLSDYKRQTKYMGTSVEHSGMTARQANELTRNAEVVREAIGFKNSSRKQIRPTWQDAW